ncbi:MAG: cation:dicarboxylate symporter family transporter, partial [Candidatus Ornithomonoglobus sp.]
MKKILKKYTETNLIIRIAIGLVIGALIGLFLPSWSVIGIFGDIFVGALKAVAPVLVFILVVCSLANAGKGIGKRFRTVIILYMVSTFLAAVVAVFVSRAFPTTLVLSQAYESDGEVVQGIGE